MRWKPAIITLEIFAICISLPLTSWSHIRVRNQRIIEFLLQQLPATVDATFCIPEHHQRVNSTPILVDDLSRARETSNNYCQSQVAQCVRGSLTYGQGLGSAIAVIFDPRNVEEFRDAAKGIAEFYQSNPLKVLLTYVFLIWPVAMEKWELETARILKTAGHVPLDSHFYVINSSEDQLTLWEYYCVRRSPIFQRVYPTTLYLFLQRVGRRGNFKGVTLRALVQKEAFASQVVKFRKVNNTDVIVGGLAVDMFKILGKTLNFTVEFVHGKGWIQQDQRGSLTGMGKQLLDDEADLIISYSELLLYRVEALSASLPVHTRQIEAFIAKPDLSSYRNVLVKSFHSATWAALGVSLAAVCLSTALIIVVTARHVPIDCEDTGSQPADWRAALFWLVATFILQGKNFWTPTAVPLQIVAVTTLLTSLVCYTAYAASIIAIFSSDTNPLKSIDDLAAHGFKFYENRFSFKGLWYAQSQALYMGEDHFSREIEIPDAMTRLGKSRVAFISVRPTFIGSAAKHLSLAQVCSWVDSISIRNETQIGVIYFRKFDPTKKYIDHHLARWKEGGIFFRDRDIYDQKAVNQCDPPIKQVKGLSVVDLRTAYIILIGGFLLCGFILALEALLADEHPCFLVVPVMKWCSARST